MFFLRNILGNEKTPAVKESFVHDNTEKLPDFLTVIAVVHCSLLWYPVVNCGSVRFAYKHYALCQS